jgi:predicted CopG family antitoxin
MILRSEAEVDAYIKDLIERTKGTYITQGVAFNKTSEKQIKLLKLALMEADSFSGFIKELLTIRYNGGFTPPTLTNALNSVKNEKDESVKKNADDWI